MDAPPLLCWCCGASISGQSNEEKCTQCHNLVFPIIRKGVEDYAYVSMHTQNTYATGYTIRTCTCSHTHTCTHMHTHMHTHMRTHMRTHMHMHAHMRIDTRTNTHKHRNVVHQNQLFLHNWNRKPTRNWLKVVQCVQLLALRGEVYFGACAVACAYVVRMDVRSTDVIIILLLGQMMVGRLEGGLLKVLFCFLSLLLSHDTFLPVPNFLLLWALCSLTILILSLDVSMDQSV